MKLPDTYGLNLPAEWVEFPTEAKAFDKAVKVAISAARDQQGWTKTLERRFELLMHQTRESLVKGNVSFLATLLAVDADEPVPAQEVTADQLLAASCVVSTMTKGALDSPVPLLAPVLLAAYTAERDESAAAVNLEPAAIVELGDCGEVVRLVRTMEVGAARAQVRLFVETYLVPVSDGEAVCVLQFATPNLDAARDFSELFNAVASTLRVFYEGTPTIDPKAPVDA